MPPCPAQPTTGASIIPIPWATRQVNADSGSHSWDFLYGVSRISWNQKKEPSLKVKTWIQKDVGWAGWFSQVSSRSIGARLRFKMSQMSDPWPFGSLGEVTICFVFMYALLHYLLDRQKSKDGIQVSSGSSLLVFIVHSEKLTEYTETLLRLSCHLPRPGRAGEVRGLHGRMSSCCPGSCFRGLSVGSGFQVLSLNSQKKQLKDRSESNFKPQSLDGTIRELSPTVFLCPQVSPHMTRSISRSVFAIFRSRSGGVAWYPTMEIRGSWSGRALLLCLSLWIRFPRNASLNMIGLQRQKERLIDIVGRERICEARTLPHDKGSHGVGNLRGLRAFLMIFQMRILILHSIRINPTPLLGDRCADTGSWLLSWEAARLRFLLQG